MLLQLMANGLITGCSYALVALGFALIYNTTRIFHFAHGAVYTLGAYLLFTYWNLWSIPFIPSLLLAFISMALIGILINEAVYQPLVRRGSSPLVHIVSSLGLYIIIINIIAMLYGNETKIPLPGMQPTYTFAGIILTRIQLLIFLGFILISAVIFLVLRKTRLGITLRAMRDDPELISVMGINPIMVRRIVFALGSILAALASILNSLDVGMDPHVGMSAVLNGAVAVIIGGVGIFEGAVLGGVLLGVLQSLAIWQISARWQDMITFLVLILFLLFRPQGILGKRRRLEESAA
jgi:branched-chain amino acid transport system permease protein